MRHSILVAALVAAACWMVAPMQAAVTISYPNFSSITGLTLVGSTATATGYAGQTVLRLTPASRDQGGAAWSTSAISFYSGAGTFSTYFQFQITTPGGMNPADGIVFVLQTVANNVGGVGGTIGYGGTPYGIPNSVGIEFDTFQNTWDPNSNHVGIDIDGGATGPSDTLTSVVTASPGGVTNCSNLGTVVGTPNCMANGDLWSVWIDYNGTNLLVAVADNSATRPATNLITFPINLPCVLGGGTVGVVGTTLSCSGGTPANSAFVGFTSGTGDGWENHDIVDWTYTNIYNPINSNPAVPALSPWAMAVLGILMAAMAAMLLRKRPGRAGI
jgi:hypothetical protein